MKLARWILGGLVVAYAVVLASLYVIISMPPGRFANLIARIPSSETPAGPLFEYALPLEPIFKSARAGKLQVGDVAPDFNLKLVHGEESVRLASFRDQKPVVLIFGSYT